MDKYRMNFANKVILFAITAMVVLFSASIVFAGADQPILFKGTLQYQGGDDVSAPAEVCAYIGGELRGSHTTNVSGWYGSSYPDNTANLGVTGSSADNGKNITFTVDGVQADQEFPITEWATNAEDSPHTLNLIKSADLPVITDWSNDKTNSNATSITVNESESVRFNATADQIIDTWNWFKDGADQSNDFDNYTASWDVNGTYTVSVNATNTTNGTSNTVTWTITVNDITAPASITNLQNTTYQETYINWTWTDPADADFSKVMVYLDGTFKTNVTMGTQFYNATGLAHNTTYEISTHTVDESGNINATWVNDTARTKPSPDITPPASITNLQNTTYEQTYINWTWTDPVDADFSKVMVYLDGSFKADVTKGVQCYNATGFAADTEHEISTHTVDSVGNINATWVNHTARTKPLNMAVTATPASVTVNTPTSVLFNVTSDGTIVNGATVTLSGAFSNVSTTGADGTVTIEVNATSTGTINVTATKDGYVTAETTVTVSTAGLEGDVNGDGWVGLPDLSILGACWGTHTGQIEFDSRADLNGDTWIGLPDLSILGAHWGEHL